MVHLPAAQRALDVVSPIVIYRQIGRRPSRIYVDEAMKVVESGGAQRRLSDRVYWRTLAKPGDQIQDRPGGILIVTAAGEWYPILLAEPTPLSPDTAFTHADLAIKADQSTMDELVASGNLVDATPRRPKGPPSRPSDKMFADNHPLVVEELPRGTTLTAEMAPTRRPPGNWMRGARPASR